MSKKIRSSEKYSHLLRTDVFDNQLYTCLIHYLYKSGFISVGISLIILCGLYFLLINQIGLSVLNFKLWCSAVLIISAIRLINTIDYFRSPMIREQVHNRELYFAVTSFLHGVSWLYFLMFVLNSRSILPIHEYYMLIIVISSLVAGGINTLAASTKSFFLFTVPVVLGITYNFLFIQQTMYMSFVMSVLFIFLIAVYFNNSVILKENVTARLLNEIMLKELERHNSSLVSEIIEKSKQAHLNWEMAHKDSLTGLDNRRSLEMQITMLSKKMDQISNNALVFIDLDDFKKVNDTLGHNIGDQLLIEVGKRLKSNVKQHDLVVRQGGDEFIILLSNVKTQQTAEIIVKRLLAKIAELYMIESFTVNITASIGVYLFDAQQHESLEELINQADKALYAVKQEHKNNYYIVHNN